MTRYREGNPISKWKHFATRGDVGNALSIDQIPNTGIIMDRGRQFSCILFFFYTGKTI